MASDTNVHESRGLRVWSARECPACWIRAVVGHPTCKSFLCWLREFCSGHGLCAVFHSESSSLLWF